MWIGAAKFSNYEGFFILWQRLILSKSNSFNRLNRFAIVRKYLQLTFFV